MSLLMSKIGLGCWSYGGDGIGKPDDEKSISIIKRGGELGITHLDTAQDYGKGHSEHVIGRAVSGSRDKYFISSKVHQVNSAEEIENLVKESLKRLNTDWVDLFYIHWPHKGMDLRPMMEGLENCRRKGLISQIGVSNFSVNNMIQASEVGKIDVNQTGFNLLWRFPEKDIIPWCRKNNIRTVAYSPIAQGLLSDRGTDLSRRSPDDPRNKTIFYKSEVWSWLRPLVQKMQGVSKGTNYSLSELALQWVIHLSDMDSVITGASSIEQLESHAMNINNKASKKDLEELQTLSDEVMDRMSDNGNIFQYHP